MLDRDPSFLWLNRNLSSNCIHKSLKLYENYSIQSTSLANGYNSAWKPLAYWSADTCSNALGKESVKVEETRRRHRGPNILLPTSWLILLPRAADLAGHSDIREYDEDYEFF